MAKPEAADSPLAPEATASPGGTKAVRSAPANARGRRGNNPFVNFEYPNSLFGEILDWMLAPLLLLWPISIAATNHVANYIANQPYDQALADDVSAILHLVKIEGDRVTVNLPAAARTLLHSDDTDQLYYQVIGPNSRLLQGDREIPWPVLPAKIEAGKVLFRDERIELGSTAEGVRTARLVAQFAKVNQVFMPVTQAISDILSLSESESADSQKLVQAIDRLFTEPLGWLS